MRIFAYDRFRPGVTLETIEPVSKRADWRETAQLVASELERHPPRPTSSPRTSGPGTLRPTAA
jgi:hypothetical protein